ncbi:hypothetical protein [Propioniciclava soli]|uniref:hypothetical protein n=1 Tax=Propioniciclava soli TaxID=2775081 RepID=UPI001E4670DE|nr:hypothetical protein [Propioniciclava soli]
MIGREVSWMRAAVAVLLVGLLWWGWTADIGAAAAWQSRVFVVVAALTVWAAFASRSRAARAAALLGLGVSVGIALTATDWPAVLASSRGAWMVWFLPGLAVLVLRSLRFSALESDRPALV